MQNNESKALVRFLAGASRTSQGEFFLAHLNRAANLEREMRERLHTLAGELAWVLLGELLRDHGEELVVALSSPQRRRLKR